MLRSGFTMVLWSYLLLSTPVAASLERVLAPLIAEPEEDGGTVAAKRSWDEVAPAEEGVADRPRDGRLVESVADELDLLTELEIQLSERLEPAGRLRLIPVSSLPRVPKSAELPEVELVEHPSRLGATSILLRFRFLDGGRILATHAASFRVQVLAEVWVPTHRLEAGEVLDAADVALRETDIVREPKAVAADATLFGRYELARAVTPDRPLSWSDLAARALVRKGQLVDVVAQEGLLTISMKGQATRSGALGEVVTIRNLESKREFSAEVVDENKVRVHF